MNYQPATLDDVVGQVHLVTRLRVAAEAALLADERLPHLLFIGPSGTGKATMARVLADTVCAPLTVAAMPLSASDLAPLLRVEGVLLITELHAAPAGVQARLLAYLDGADGPSVIGSTSRGGIAAGLFDAFDLAPAWAPYSPQDLVLITAQVAAAEGLILSPATIASLAAAAGGNPGQAARLVRSTRDLTVWHDREPSIDEVLVQAGFAADGLTEAHLAYLGALGLLGSASQSLLALTTRLHATVCADLEVLLVSLGLVDFGGQGRYLTDAGRRRLEQEGSVAA